MGVVDGARFGIPDRTYVQARVRSARALPLAAELDGSQNVVSLSEQQLTLTTAWPAFAFEKVDEKRASCLVGTFVTGSLNEDTTGVIAKLEKGDAFRDIAAFTIARAGEEFAIVQLDQLTAWLQSQAGQSLADLKQAMHLRAARAQKEFASLVHVGFDASRSARTYYADLIQKHVGCADSQVPSRALD